MDCGLDVFAEMAKPEYLLARSLSQLQIQKEREILYTHTAEVHPVSRTERERNAVHVHCWTRFSLRVRKTEKCWAHTSEQNPVFRTERQKPLKANQNKTKQIKSSKPKEISISNPNRNRTKRRKKTPKKAQHSPVQFVSNTTPQQCSPPCPNRNQEGNSHKQAPITQVTKSTPHTLCTTTQIGGKPSPRLPVQPILESEAPARSPPCSIVVPCVGEEVLARTQW
jgi:hypothetical protein